MEVDFRLASQNLMRLKISSGQPSCAIEIVWCRVMQRQYETKQTRMHHHTFYELHLAVKGQGGFQIGGEGQLVLREGDFLLIPPTAPHEYSWLSEDFEDFVTGFQITFDTSNPNGRFVAEAFEHYRQLQPYPADEAMLQYVRDILQSAFRQDPGMAAIVEANFKLILLRIAHIFCPFYRAPNTSRRTFSYDLQFQLIERYIRENLHLHLTSDQIASQLNISAKQLNRILQQHYQTTIRQMLRDCRLAQIRQDLENTDLTLEQIAERTGFSNEFNLSRFFKQAEGMSPGSYRRSFLK